MSYSSTVRAADVTEQRRRQDECTTRAIVEGTKAAALAGLVSGGCGQLLKAVSEAYRLKFTAGPRAAVVAMPVFAAFWVVSEKQVMTCSAKRDSRWKSLDTLNGYERLETMVLDNNGEGVGGAAAAASAAAAPAAAEQGQEPK